MWRHFSPSQLTGADTFGVWRYRTAGLGIQRGTGMAEGGVPYPQVFVVEGQIGVPPTLPVRHPRCGALLQKILVLLVSLALCAVAVEAYFIYRLYNLPINAPMGTPAKQFGKQEGPVLGLRNLKDQREGNTPPTERSGSALKPPKAAAHLTDLRLPVELDGVLKWGGNGDAFSGGVEHRAGSLQVKREGFYFIYSKVTFAEPTCSMFKHKVLMRTPRYYRELELMQAKRFSCRNSKQPEEGMLNSYLGGVFHLHASDSVFVMVENHTLVRHHDTSDSFFGMFMI
ncbi:hypothetical protein SKAU_G00425720 [Synaphobranchus kaupii]|uniref:THD domain-containing protein n=1 Tax=Synaphobranchus kaupii TaxID=118154 RepID=A0A9Q1IAF1_SYNKA|nr:hypothetical protein SKAU_G00425720 [Synaphobranchus kaupii]